MLQNKICPGCRLSIKYTQNSRAYKNTKNHHNKNYDYYRTSLCIYCSPFIPFSMRTLHKNINDDMMITQRERFV